MCLAFPPRRPGCESSVRLALAAAAVDGGTLSDDTKLEYLTASTARLTHSAVHVEVRDEMTGIPIRTHKVSQRGSAPIDRFTQYRPNMIGKAIVTPAGNTPCGPSRVDARPKQRLVA